MAPAHVPSLESEVRGVVEQRRELRRRRPWIAQCGCQQRTAYIKPPRPSDRFLQQQHRCLKEEGCISLKLLLFLLRSRQLQQHQWDPNKQFTRNKFSKFNCWQIKGETRRTKPPMACVQFEQLRIHWEGRIHRKFIPKDLGPTGLCRPTKFTCRVARGPESDASNSTRLACVNTKQRANASSLWSP